MSCCSCASKRALPVRSASFGLVVEVVQPRLEIAFPRFELLVASRQVVLLRGELAVLLLHRLRERLVLLRLCRVRLLPSPALLGDPGTLALTLGVEGRVDLRQPQLEVRVELLVDLRLPGELPLVQLVLGRAPLSGQVGSKVRALPGEVTISDRLPLTEGCSLRRQVRSLLCQGGLALCQRLLQLQRVGLQLADLGVTSTQFLALHSKFSVAAIQFFTPQVELGGAQV